MRRYRVLVLPSSYPRKGDSIAGTFIHQQVCHIAQLGCDVIVLCPLPYMPKWLATNPRRKSYRLTPLEDKLDGIRILYPRYVRPPGKKFHAPSAFTLSCAISRQIDKLQSEFRPDILHVHMATPHGYAGLRLGRKLGIPLVVSLLGSDIDVYPYWNNIIFNMTKLVIAKADRLTAVSQSLKSDAENIASPRKEIEVVYTGCDHNRYMFNAPDRNTYRSKLGILPEELLLIFIGRLLDEKGLFELIEAFQRALRILPNLRLVIIGDGREGDAIADRVNNKGVQNHVFQLGARPNEEIPGWLSAADILILPSWHEGLPNVIVEAMSCQRPVIATDVGGIPEAVEEGKSGILVQKGDAKAMSDAIVDLALNPERRRLMGLEGRRIVKEKFSWVSNAQAVIAIYEQLLSADSLSTVTKENNTIR